MLIINANANKAILILQIINMKLLLLLSLLCFKITIGLISCPPNCGLCSMLGFCLNCYSQYYLTGAICNPCVRTCQSCSQTSSCSSCQSAFGLYPGNICYACVIPNCVSCDGDFSKCSYCDSGYAVINSTYSYNGYTVSNVCVPCIQNHCQDCSTDINSCNTCWPPFIWTGTRCGNASCNTTNALECQSVNSCSSNCLNCPSFVAFTGYACYPCSDVFPNCQNCDTLQCLTCASGFYTNNASTIYLYHSQYECYYAGLLTCEPCLPNCDTCLDGPSCFNCSSGYFLSTGSWYYAAGSYLNTTVCLPCMRPCLQCYGFSTNCTTCDPAGNIYESRGNVCNTCNMSNCTSCSNSTTCLSCELQITYLLNAACVGCTSPCLLCRSATDCITCVDDTFYYFNNSCLSCSTALANCTNCNSATVCFKCANDTFLIQCNCIPSSTYNCLTAYNSQCTQCATAFNLINGSCCSAHCISCNALSCIACQTNYTVLNGACVSCVVPFMFVDVTCVQCVYPCIECSSKYLCQACDQYHYLENGLCKDYCGDGILFDLQCDLSVDNDNDGCMSDCTVQPMFYCNKILSNVYSMDPLTLMNVSRVAYVSQCVFNGTLSIKKIEVKKHLFQNKHQISFKINPYLHGLPNNTIYSLIPSNVPLMSTMYRNLLASFNTIHSQIQYSYSVNEAQHTITFIIENSPQLQAVTLQIDFSSLAINSVFHQLTTLSLNYNLNQINYDTSSPIDPTINTLAYYMGTAFGVLGSLAAVLGVITKQLAGLQFAILCQLLFIVLSNLNLPLQFYSLRNIGYASGLNLPLFPSPSNVYCTQCTYAQCKCTDSQQNSIPQILLLTNNFINNFNIMGLFYIFPILVAIFAHFWLQCNRNKVIPNKLFYPMKLKFRFSFEVQLYVVLFNFTMLFTAGWNYFRGNDFTFYWNSLLLACFSVITLTYLIVYLLKPGQFGIFRLSFIHVEQKGKLAKCIQPNWSNSTLFTKLAYNYSFVYIINLIIMVVWINLFPSTVYWCGVEAVHLLYLVVVRPYSNVMDTIRSVWFGIVLCALPFVQILGMYGLVAMYGIAAVITYVSLIIEGYGSICKSMHNRKHIVEKLFNFDVEKEKEKIGELIGMCENEKQLRQGGDGQGEKQYNPMNIIVCQEEDKDENQVDGDRKYSKNGQKIKGQEEKNNKIKYKADNKMNFQKEQGDESQQSVLQTKVIEKQMTHLKYLEAHQFIRKYGKTIDYQLINKYYHDI